MNTIADKKAEQNFHFIMGMIKHQSNKKQQQEAALKKEQTGKDSKVLDGKGKGEGQKVLASDIDEGNLITYREFMNAIKGLKNSLYKSILPRTLTFE